eukprot:Pgem_evm1s5085
MSTPTLQLTFVSLTIVFVIFGFISVANGCNSNQICDEVVRGSSSSFTNGFCQQYNICTDFVSSQGCRCRNKNNIPPLPLFQQIRDGSNRFTAYNPYRLNEETISAESTNSFIFDIQSDFYTVDENNNLITNENAPVGAQVSFDFRPNQGIFINTLLKETTGRSLELRRAGTTYLSGVQLSLYFRFQVKDDADYVITVVENTCPAGISPVDGLECNPNGYTDYVQSLYSVEVSDEVYRPNFSGPGTMTKTIRLSKNKSY